MADLDHGPSRRQVLRITAVAGVSIALGGGLTRSLLRRAGLRELRETRAQMGTLVTISVVHPDAVAARAMVAETFAVMERLEGLLSRHREGTPVSPTQPRRGRSRPSPRTRTCRTTGPGVLVPE